MSYHVTSSPPSCFVFPSSFSFTRSPCPLLPSHSPSSLSASHFPFLPSHTPSPHPTSWHNLVCKNYELDPWSRCVVTWREKSIPSGTRPTPGMECGQCTQLGSVLFPSTGDGTGLSVSTSNRSDTHHDITLQYSNTRLLVHIYQYNSLLSVQFSMAGFNFQVESAVRIM